MSIINPIIVQSGGDGGSDSGIQYDGALVPQLLFVVDGGMNSAEVSAALATCEITRKNITDDTLQTIDVPIQADVSVYEQRHGRGLALTTLAVGKEYRIEKVDGTFIDNEGNEHWSGVWVVHVCGLGLVSMYQTPPTKVLCNFRNFGTTLLEADKELTRFNAHTPSYANYLFRISLWAEDD